MDRNVKHVQHQVVFKEVPVGTEIQWGGGNKLYLRLQPPPKWFCVKLGSAMISSNVSLLVSSSHRTIHKPQLMKAEGDSNQQLSAYQYQPCTLLLSLTSPCYREGLQAICPFTVTLFQCPQCQLVQMLHGQCHRHAEYVLYVKFCTSTSLHNVVVSTSDCRSSGCGSNPIR